MRPGGRAPSSIDHVLELRRALLLFAIVLGVAAIVTSVSNPSDRDRTDPEPAGEPPTSTVPTPTPSAAAKEPVNVRFEPKGPPRRAVIGTGRPVTVTVAVEEAGEVELDGLGLNAPATPLTPARFDLLPSEPGRHEVRLIPADTREPATVGVLQVESAE